MSNLTICFLISTVIFFSTSVFLGKEMMKKFGFMNKFIKNSENVKEFFWPGANKLGLPKGMRNILIVWDYPFEVLIGFDLVVPGFGSGYDYYGQSASVFVNGRHEAIISIYLGNGEGPTKFFFNRNVDENLKISCNKEDQDKKPHVVYPPHWWQRLGFWA